MRYRAQLEEIYAENEGEKIKVIAQIIRDEHPEIDLRKSSLIEYLRKIKREGTFVTKVKNDDSWKVIADSAGVNTYNWVSRGQSQSYSVDFIDNLFTYYSRKGYNYTRIRAQQKFGLTPKAWSQISQQFQLSKDCDLLSPFTLQNTPQDELEGIIDSRISTLLSSGEMTSQKYTDSVIKKHRRVIEKANLRQSFENDVISTLLEEFPSATKISLTTTTDTKISSVVGACGDLHALGKSKGMKLFTEDWNTGVLIEKLHNMADVLNSYKAEKTTVLILGDLVESISGLSHLDSWKGLEAGGWGANAIIQTYELIVEHLLNRVNNLSKIVMTGGNHDRLQASHSNGDRGVTDIIAYMLTNLYAKEGIPVQYDENMVAFEEEGFNIVGVHGDKGMHKRELAYLTLKFAPNPKKFTFVLSAHLHSFFCQRNDDQEFARRITIPSIVTANGYSDVEVGRGAQSGFAVLYTNVVGKPTMVIETL